MEKYPIDPSRIRHLPARFSWLDQRLIKDAHLRGCPRSSQALYLFLAVVSDARGLSYYSERSIGEHLAMERDELAQARRALVDAGLVAFERPLYQLLSLDPWKVVRDEPSARRTGATLRLADLIRLPAERPASQGEPS